MSIMTSKVNVGYFIVRENLYGKIEISNNKIIFCMKIIYNKRFIFMNNSVSFVSRSCSVVSHLNL